MPRQLSILIIYQYFGTPSGGWSTRYYELARRWVASGVKVTVITSPYYKSDIVANGFISFQETESINLIVIDAGDSNKASKLARICNALIFACFSSYYAIKMRSDINISSSGPITVGIPGIFAKIINRKKLVFEVRDLWPQGAIEMGIIKNRFLQWLGLKFESISYRISDLVVPCSTGMENSIKNRFPGVRTLVIPNACDNELFSTCRPLNNLPEWANNPKNTILVYFGSLGVMDACDEIIQGLKRVSGRFDIHIVFIGDGSERSNLETLADELSLSENIHFFGLLPKKELVGWLKISKASFVVFKNYPVLSTSSPNKMFDSFASGLPVIQNTKGWIKDLIDKNGCGVNVEPENANSMADAIIYISDLDNEKLSTMKSAAHRLASIDFNRDLLSEKYLNSILSLL